MNEEGLLRSNLSRVFVILSEKNVDPERMRIASEKMEEVVGILCGRVPLPVTEGERG